MQNNIFRVTSHIRKKLEEAGETDIDRKVLTLIPTHDGKLYYRDNEGNYWRMTLFIKDSKSYDDINPELAYRRFGHDFQRMLSDLPGEPLHRPFPFSQHGIPIGNIQRFR